MDEGLSTDLHLSQNPLDFFRAMMMKSPNSQTVDGLKIPAASQLVYNNTPVSNTLDNTQYTGFSAPSTGMKELRGPLSLPVTHSNTSNFNSVSILSRPDPSIIRNAARRSFLKCRMT